MRHNILQGKRGLIFGAVDQHSLAWHVARQCHAEGAQLVLTNSAYGVQLGEIDVLATEVNAPVIVCDATDVEQLTLLISRSIELLGGKLDFILHAVAQSPNIRRHRSYTDINYNYMLETMDISAISLHRILQVCHKQDALNEWASVVALTFIGSHRPLADYVDMGDAKALLESVARTFGRVYGEDKHVRINTIGQSPTLTRAGCDCEGMSMYRQFTDQIAPLGNADSESCAALCAMLFSDYARFVTMQTIFNDGGFSSTGLSHKFTEFVAPLYRK